jgi:hypothetical protein
MRAVRSFMGGMMGQTGRGAKFSPRGCRTKKLEGGAGDSERRVALGFPKKIPMKAGCKPALQLVCPAPSRRFMKNFSLQIRSKPYSRSPVSQERKTLWKEDFFGACW